MDTIVESFFRPWATGYWRKYSYRFRRLQENEAIQGAVVACFLKFDRFNPEFGSPLNYFTKIIQRHLQAESISEQTYHSRFGSLDAIDDEPAN